MVLIYRHCLYFIILVVLVAVLLLTHILVIFCCIFLLVNLFILRVQMYLDTLQNIADNLVGTNTMLQSLYGDIVSLLNNMYTRMGNIETVERTANSYLAQIYSQLLSLNSSISDNNSKADLIYTLLSAYMPYLNDIVLNSEDIYVALENELSSIDGKLDTFLALYDEFLEGFYTLLSNVSDSALSLSSIESYLSVANRYFMMIWMDTTDIESDLQSFLSLYGGFLEDFDILLSNVSDSALALSAIKSYMSTASQCLMQIWMNSTNIESDLQSFINAYLDVAEYAVSYYTANMGLADKLDTIITILEEFSIGYMSGAQNYEFPDGYVVDYADGTTSEKFSFFDLVKAVVNGIWHVITGAVTTFIGGLSGLISGISNVSGFFDFYRDGEIYDAIDYGGGDIWD